MRALLLLALVPFLATAGEIKLSAAAKTGTLKQNPNDLKDFGCSFCDAFVRALETFLEQGHTEAEALAYMETLCEDLTHQKLLCQAFIATQGRTILDKLLAQLAPEQICEDIRLCP